MLTYPDKPRSSFQYGELTSAVCFHRRQYMPLSDEAGAEQLLPGGGNGKIKAGIVPPSPSADDSC